MVNSYNPKTGTINAIFISKDDYDLESALETAVSANIILIGDEKKSRIDMSDETIEYRLPENYFQKISNNIAKYFGYKRKEQRSFCTLKKIYKKNTGACKIELNLKLPVQWWCFDALRNQRIIKELGVELEEIYHSKNNSTKKTISF